MRAGRTPRDPLAVSTLAHRHLLLLDAHLEPSDVIALACNHFPDLGDPQELVPTRPGRPGVLHWQLTRHSALQGPLYVPPEDREKLGLPDWVATVFSLVVPRDREPSPPPVWLQDPDGFNSFFPEGLPNKEEGRLLTFLLGLARRLHVALRLADEPGARDEAARIIVPDPSAAVDVYVYSRYWLAPELLLDHLVNIDAAARFPAMPSAAQLAKVSHLIDPADSLELDGYAIEVPLTTLGVRAGGIEVRVMPETHVPRIVAEVEAGPWISYHLHWMDAENKRFSPDIDPELERIRTAATMRLERLAAETITAVGGIALDEGGFLVTANQLG